MGRLIRILCGLTGTLIAVGVGLVVGAIGWAHLPEPGLGIVAGVIAGFATSAVVMKLWSWRVGRALVVLATLGHVAYWSWLGFQEMGARAPSASLAEPVFAVADPAFHVGHARVSFNLPVNAPLAGWGSGPRRQALPAFGGLGPLGRKSLAFMAEPTTGGAARTPLLSTVGETSPSADRVGAGAIVIRGRTPQAGGVSIGPAVALVNLDTVTVDTELFQAIHDGVRGLGIPASGLVVAATHTHSGPGGYSRQPLSQILGTGHFHEETFNNLVFTAVSAIRQAFESARPARVAFVRTRDRGPEGPVLAMNRRRDDDMIDDRVLGMRFDAMDGQPIAVALNYAVHPVVFRRRHPFAERDLVGAIEREVRASVGAPLVLLNGSLGDVSPRPTPGDLGAKRCTVLAKRFAKLIAQGVRTAVAHDLAHVAMQRRSLDLGTPLGVRAWGDRGVIAAEARKGFGDSGIAAWIADAATLPLNAFIWSLGLPEVRLIARFGSGVGATANVSRLVPRTKFWVGAIHFEAGDERLALLWHPGEATQAVGRAWRAHAAEAGIADAMVVGLANGACAYLTDAAEYRRSSYEARATLFGGVATEHIGHALRDALAAAQAAAHGARGN